MSAPAGRISEGDALPDAYVGVDTPGQDLRLETPTPQELHRTCTDHRGPGQGGRLGPLLHQQRGDAVLTERR